MLKFNNAVNGCPWLGRLAATGLLNEGFLYFLCMFGARDQLRTLLLLDSQCLRCSCSLLLAAKRLWLAPLALQQSHSLDFRVRFMFQDIYHFYFARHLFHIYFYAIKTSTIIYQNYPHTHCSTALTIMLVALRARRF